MIIRFLEKIIPFIIIAALISLAHAHAESNQDEHASYAKSEYYNE